MNAAWPTHKDIAIVFLTPSKTNIRVTCRLNGDLKCNSSGFFCLGHDREFKWGEVIYSVSNINRKLRVAPPPQQLSASERS